MSGRQQVTITNSGAGWTATFADRTELHAPTVEVLLQSLLRIAQEVGESTFCWPIIPPRNLERRGPNL